MSTSTVEKNMLNKQSSGKTDTFMKIFFHLYNCWKLLQSVILSQIVIYISLENFFFWFAH